MSVSCVIQQTSNFIDVKIYYKKQLGYNVSIITKAGTFLYIYINTVSTCGDANNKHAMLMNGASVEISQQVMTHCLFWRDVVVCLSFTNFCDWPSVDPDLPTSFFPAVYLWWSHRSDIYHHKCCNKLLYVPFRIRWKTKKLFPGELWYVLVHAAQPTCDARLTM